MSESPPSSASSSSSTTSLPRLPTPPSPIPSFRPRRPREGSTNTTRSYSHSSTRDLSDWEIEELEEIHRAGGKRRNRPEPTSPVKAVLYVVCLYLIFQILTRSDELDIFPSSTSSIRQSHSPPSSMEVPSYPHLPYGFPPIPNPIPSALPPAQGTSWWRLFFGVLLYPVYLLVTLLTTPLPLLLNLLYLLARLLKIILYPIVVVMGALYGTFIVAPLGVVGRILEAFYPLVMFVGGLVGVGLFLGLSVGWVGRWVLDGILRWRNHRDSASRLRRMEKRKEKEEKRQARLEFELERIHDRMIPKTPTISQRGQSVRKPVLNIGTSNLRGTKKDERRSQELAGSGSGMSRSGSGYGYGRRHSSSGSSSERLTTPTATSGSSGKKDHKITTFDKTYTTSRKDGGGRERRLTFQDDLDMNLGRGEPVMVGIRKRGIRETYTVQG